MKKKFVLIGDTDSINIEVIVKTHKYVKNKVRYILLGDKREFIKYYSKLSSNLKINSVIDPINFSDYKKESLNIFDIQNVRKKKFSNLINQINFSNYLSSKSKIDLITMPINKSLFKKNIDFVGMTEYLGHINNKKTTMLMYGNKFSVIPLTTHINLKDVNFSINKNFLDKNLNNILINIKKKNYYLNFNEIKFLCDNSHCSENKSLGIEDNIISNSLKKFKSMKGTFHADSAFKNINLKTLFISMYHDQFLIPFKILNTKSFNLTLGLNYRRLSPAHGTASDIKFQNKANIVSYLECMNF